MTGLERFLFCTVVVIPTIGALIAGVSAIPSTPRQPTAAAQREKQLKDQLDAKFFRERQQREQQERADEARVLTKREASCRDLGVGFWWDGGSCHPIGGNTITVPRGTTIIIQ